MEETHRPPSPVGNQTIDPGLLQQVLLALSNIQVQTSNRAGGVGRETKIPDVQTFNGNKKEYSVFLARIKNFFSIQPNSYNTDVKKIG